MTKTPPNSNSSKKLVETCPPFISHPITMNFKMKIGLKVFSFGFTFEVFSQKKEAGTFCGKRQQTIHFDIFMVGQKVTHPLLDDTAKRSQCF